MKSKLPFLLNLLFLCFFVFTDLDAQNPSIEKEFQKMIKKKNSVELIPKFLTKYQKKGYAEIHVDTSAQPFQLHIGKIYILDSYTNNLNLMLKNGNLKIKNVFSWSNFNEFHQKILKYYGNLGYPMVQIEPHFNYEIQRDTVFVKIKEDIDLKKSYSIDSILLPKNIKENPKFVYQLIDLQPGDKFHQEKIEKISQNLKKSQYYQQVLPPKIQFSDSTCKIILDFQKYKNNRFDLLIGLLPPQNNTQKLQFTATADFSMVSMFRQGEILRLKYDKLQNISQKMNLEYLHPYLFRLPIKFRFQFDLFKQDTSFLNRFFNVGGSYLINQESEIIISYQQKSSNLISVTKYQNITWPPPSQLDSKSNTYLLGYQFKQLDNPLNPTKGIFLNFSGSTGIRKILKVKGLENLDYDKIGKIQPKQEIEIKIFKYTSIGKRTVGVLGLQAYYLKLNNYFENDLKPIGGYKILRGFNENQFWAAHYLIGTLELRLLLEELSYIGIFADLGYLNQKKYTQNQIFRPIGMGIAINFDTNLGIMSVSYAIGKYENLNFQPTRGRIHVGIINNF